jgi:hypothetical protein
MLHRVLVEEKISYPINSPHFTKSKVSLFVQTANCPYSEPNTFSPYHPAIYD